MTRILVLALTAAFPLFGQASLSTIKKIYVDKMPNDLDQYLRAEITKQFKGKVTVVLQKEDADAILTGAPEEK